MDLSWILSRAKVDVFPLSLAVYLPLSLIFPLQAPANIFGLMQRIDNYILAYFFLHINHCTSSCNSQQQNSVLKV